MKSFFSRRLFLLVCIIFTGCISTAATSVYTADVGFPANVMTTDPMAVSPIKCLLTK